MSDELEFVLRQLSEDDRPVRSIGLAPLSDLSQSQAALFRAVWAELDAERRFELTSELVEQAETNVHLNFATILRDALQDPDARVRKLAVEGLWEDSRPGLVGLLVTLLAHDTSSDVRAAAATSLGRFVLLGELGEIPDTVAGPAAGALREAWTRPQEVNEVRRRALEGLAYSDDTDVHELIQNAYFDEDELMRQSAVFAMGRSGDRRWTKSVLAELASRDAAMRFEAATAAGELGLTGAVRPLVQLLDDADSSVREAAALALGQIGGPEAQRALEACAAGEDERLAQAAEEALAELKFNSGALENPLFDFPGGQAGRAAGAGELDDADLSPEAAFGLGEGFAEWEDDEEGLFDDDAEDDADDDYDEDQDYDDDEDRYDLNGEDEDDEE